ncbi:MAG: hypothetical protein DRQ24_04525 [Candidatus Latescibacterota bacterium]|nr:MAG: hypothetical protein DRQ24_04525 [Candidatus Latescibacterota bacterium]
MLRGRKYYETFPILKGFLFVAAVVFVFAFLIYTQGVVRRLREQEKKATDIFANLYAAAATSVTATGIELDIIVEDVIKKTNFPVIITDAKGKPRVWKGVGISSADSSDDSLVLLKQMVAEMDRQNSPIPLVSEKLGGLFGYLHYGQSTAFHRLTWLPFVEIGVILVFVFMGFLGFRHIKNSEQRYIWIGMAKEAAHQLGTPISSLFGWLELLKAKAEDGISSIVEEMENDVSRLNKITSRFNQIGLTPKLRRENVVPIITETVAYFQKRLPQLGTEVKITGTYEEVPDIPVNRELLSWAFENLLRNSLDAIDKQGGRIDINVRSVSKGKAVAIDFSDNGRGLNSKQQRKVFMPGYTTKNTGWGLGLSFVKRVIKEYHGGRVFVAKSAPGKGTTIRVVLPK